MSNDLYDLQYEAWRAGHNPDEISRDDLDYFEMKGFLADQLSVDHFFTDPDGDLDFGGIDGEGW